MAPLSCLTRRFAILVCLLLSTSDLALGQGSEPKDSDLFKDLKQKYGEERFDHTGAEFESCAQLAKTKGNIERELKEIAEVIAKDEQGNSSQTLRKTHKSFLEFYNVELNIVVDVQKKKVCEPQTS